MHGREQREGESHHRRIVVVRKSGCGGQHMRSVPLSTTRNSLADGSGDSSLVSTVITIISSDSFCKDGRRISVGDCALFKPPQDSPPFIGIIRCLRPNKENNLQLGVNWLYRPAELKLGKGILLDAAPNEIFYSFHEDETPAASLLHPCKVAFLPKGVELPSGISSFVCRRVYDIDNKCLWWLTDQDYINERQEEVDKLLQKSRIEMDAPFQSGNRSPKPTNNSLSTSQFKPNSDNVQSSATSFPSKGKKRERGDQASDPVKRERSLKPDDSDSGLYKSESFLKSEIAKMTEKGGVVDSESVEKLVVLMQPDKVDKKLDLISRSMLAGVIAATDKLDCLNRFVQLKGLTVFDEWLQDVHKGKIGDSSDKSAEDFLLVLLRALDKLPVNLHALQTCNIGRSVNHLRSHKNLEIQKKARGLVDTWKKRVEAEMNMIDAKTGSTQATSWPSKSRLPEAHGGRSTGGSGDVALKSSVTQLSASKTMSVKVSQVETAGKSASPSPGAVKSTSSPASGKESQPRITTGSTSDIPLSTREERSSSSSQSHNYSQSFSGKEDARTSTAGSMSVNKISSGGSRHRKSVNGFPGTLVSGSQKETGSSRNSSIHRTTAQEKFSQSVAMGEKAFETPVVEGATPKLIVKLPNRGRSPAQSVSGGSYEDPSIMSSRASSPVLSDKHEPSERTKEKADACRANVISDVNAESWQSNDFKDLHTGSDEGDGSPTAVPEEERSRPLEDGTKVPEVPKAASSSSGNDLKSGKLHDASFSSMNALIESCVKYSEASTPVSLGDDVGMNLLASVAAGEMYKSDLLTPADSPQECSLPVEELSNGEAAKSKSSPPETLVRERCEPNDVDGDDLKRGKSASSWSKDGICLSKQASLHSTGDRKAAPASSEEILQATTECYSEMNEKYNDILVSNSLSPTTKVAKDRDLDSGKQSSEEKGVEVKLSVLSSTEDVKPKAEVPSNPSMEIDCKKDSNEMSNNVFLTEPKPEGEELPATGSIKDLASENVDSCKVRETDEDPGDSGVNQSEGATLDPKPNVISASEDKNLDGLSSDVTDQKPDCLKTNSEKMEVTELHAFGTCDPKEEPTVRSKEVVGDIDLKEAKKSDAEAAELDERVSSVAGATSLTSVHVPDMDSKMNFDLNEGLVSDDGKYGEPTNLSTVNVVNSLSTTVSMVSSSIPASITVAAALKGPFVPPVDLLRNKGELGWKGSAATSAFRPAEPRKVLQLPLGSANVCPPDDSTGRTSRPPLDIDLNVPDERVLEDMACRDSSAEISSNPDQPVNLDRSRNELTGSAPGRVSGGLDLDLNRVDDANDITQYPTSSIRRLEIPVVPFKSLSSSSNNEVKRDFDLNNGPGIDDGAAEQSSFTQHGRGSTQSVHSLPALAGLRSNNLETGNFSAWFPPGTSYSSITIPSALSDRGEQPFAIIPPGAPQRLLGPPGGNPFNPDVYRGSVLSSSPAVPFAPSPFPYQMFPFGTTLPSATFSVGSNSFMDSSSGGRIFTSPVNSQFLGPVGAVSSQFPRPYMVSVSDGSNSGGVESNRKWSRQGLDLNAGPGVLDIEGREESLAQRQLPVGSSQALAEEQARMFPLSGGVLKRKEPDGGWDGEGFRYKQSSWQ